MSLFADAIPKRYQERVVNILSKPFEWLLSALDFVLLPVQRLIGVNRMAYVFLLPNLLIFGIFILLPMIMNFYIGFTGGNSFAIENRPWVGAENLDRIFSCENYSDPNTCEEDIFWRGARNTFSYVVIQVSTMVTWALLTALALNGKIRFRGFFRSVFFYPVLLSPVVAALIWRWFLGVDAGVLNAIIEDLGFERISFFTDAGWSRFWVIVVSDWMFMGFYTLILLAGLQSIPGELYEAADMDGANALQRFFGITLPLLMPTMTVVLVLSLIRAVQIFDQVFVLTGGGPGTATTYMVQFIYREAFGEGNRNLGLASSASLLLASTLMVLTLAQLYFARRGEAT